MQLFKLFAVPLFIFRFKEHHKYVFSDIDKIEYDSIISKLDTSPIDYLKNKYQLIKEFYDLDKTISMNDFMAIEEFIEENEFFNEVYTSMKEFADIAVPFWSGAQMSNAKLGMAHAATLK